jgi:subtilase family serine protease
VLQVPALTAQQLRTLAGHVPQAVAASRMLAPLDRGSRLHLALGLPLRNTAELDALIADLGDPHSPRYQHFLTPEQFAAAFGPTEDEYAAAIQFAQAHHLEVTGTHSNRGLLVVTGEVNDIEEAFGVKLNLYQHPTRGQFFAADRDPIAPTGFTLQDVSGLSNFDQPHPMNLTHTAAAPATPYVTGSGPGGYFIGKDFRAAYAPSVTLTGTGQTVGLLEFDGFFPADETANFAAAGLPAVPTQTVLLDGMSGAAGGNNVEVILDIMMAAYMAPGLQKVLVYEGQVPNDILNRMATDNTAQQLSSSWGFGINATTEQIFKQFIAQGQSFLQASGDSGGYTKGVMTPSDDPSVTVVGGTSLTTAGKGGAWQSETAWSGSGGGVSTTYSIPTWQQGLNLAAKGGSNTMRNIPDVALTADIQMYLICNNGQQISVGGTSAAAPLWAGFIALANQQGAASAKPRLGFLNPTIYSLGNSGNFGSDLHDITVGSNGAFKALAGYDLATGWGSPAGQHLIYDMTGTSATGSFTLTPASTALTIVRPGSAATSVAVTQTGNFKGTVAMAVSGLPAGVTANVAAMTSGGSSLTFTVAATAATGVYPLTVTGTSGSLTATTAITLTVVAPTLTLTTPTPTLTIARPGTATAAILVSETNGLTGAASLVLSGVPAGVTASLSTSSTASSSVLTLTVSSTAAAGTSTITITGTNGTLKATTTVTLTVAVPTLTLAAQTPTLTVTRPGTATSTIVVSQTNGLTGTTALAVSGLPTGVTASLSPASTATNSLLSLTASSAAVAGTSTITITGTNGTLKATTTVSLTVTVPSFTLGFTPAALSVPRGSSVSGTAVITPVNGFSAAITLTATGLPTGVTMTLGKATTTAIPVTFAALSTTVAGSYPVTLTGVSGAITSSAKVSLTVVAAQAGTSLVNLAPYYNVQGIAIDNQAFSGPGIDGASNGMAEAYSTTVLGLSQSIAGNTFYFGPANTLDTVSSQIVALPAGQFGALKLLATGVNGAQANQVFKVTYTDGTSTSTIQSLSDWFAPASYSGETTALATAYRDTGTGLLDHRTFYLYAYSLPLNSAKTVASVTLPSNRNVVVFAATLTVGK